MDHRKRVMRCEHPTPCETCFADCKIAKEERINSDLLATCKAAQALILDLEQAGCLDNPEELHILRAAIANATK